jgi:glycosyltransferase involved in cell wall biosynthesis
LYLPEKNGHPEIAVIIPAFNEEAAIGRVLADIPTELVGEVVVVNNNSTDATRQIAEKAGAVVLDELRQGYGAACLRGIKYLREKLVKPDVVVFLDGDYSDYPGEMTELVKPIINEGIDLVIGSRFTGNRQKDAMPPQQVFGNWLVAKLIRLLFQVNFTDLGPFRAIRLEKLLALGMTERGNGWTIEMQLKAVMQGFSIREVPVSYRKRLGKSKISGTVRGALFAGYRITVALFKYR